MKPALIFSIILLLTFNAIYAQIPVGLKYDCNGYAFNGYYDPLTYSPAKKLTKVHNSDSYEVGYYYDNLGNRIDGLIKFAKDKIFYKTDSVVFRDKIKPSEINSFVIGVDSFFVVSNYYYRDKLQTDPEYVQYITEFNGLTFAKHYKFTSSIQQQYGAQPPIVETYLVQSKADAVWENFPDNSRFQASALKYFSYIPYLKAKIDSGLYTSRNMLSVIKMAEYLDKYQKAVPIYYDQYWQEVNDGRNAKYHASIVNKQDSIWTFEYYEGDTKLYLANYSSFYPNTKNGDFISYYPNGDVRQVIAFKNNRPQDVKVNNASGEIVRHYQYRETFNSTTGKTKTSIAYLTTNDSLGANAIGMPSAQSLVVNDPISKVSYTQQFNGGVLISSFRILDHDTIYQLVNPKYKFRVKSLQNKIDYYLANENYDTALSVNAQGTILISLVTDKKGFPVSCVMLNTIHPEIDTLVERFINACFMTNEGLRHKFRPYKVNKKKQFCEFVIPIEFSINRFYRRSVNYNQFNNMYWMQSQQQQMMMQMHHQQMMPTF